MNKSDLGKLFLAASVTGSVALSASAQSQVIFSEDFESYVDSASAQGTWTPVGTDASLGLNLTSDSGNNYALISRQAKDNYFTWAGNNSPGLVPEEFRTATGWAYTPTDERPLVLTISFYDPGTGGDARNTAGLRTAPGADQSQFELGFYSSDESAYMARTVRMHEPLGYHYFERGTAEDNIRIEGWHIFQATFSSTTTTVTLDLGSDEVVDHSLTFSGEPLGAFTDFRIGGIQATDPMGAPIGYDNIRLEVIPEPSTYAAIFGSLALVGAFIYRRRMIATK